MQPTWFVVIALTVLINIHFTLLISVLHSDWEDDSLKQHGSDTSAIRFILMYSFALVIVSIVTNNSLGLGW